MLANILANPLRALAQPMSEHLAPGALVILSGLLLYGLARSWSNPTPPNCVVLLIASIAAAVLWGPMLVIAIIWVAQRLIAGRPLTLDTRK